MNKLSGSTIFILLFFTLKGFGGNPLRLPTAIKTFGSPPSYTKDTSKKSTTVDTTKKAADDTADDDDDNLRSYAMGLTYGSDQSFHGIHSGKQLPYLEPNFTYTAPSGFYTLLSFQDILIKKGGLDAMDINPGWDITLADNTTLNFNISHYTFRKGTPATIKSDLSNEVATYIDQWVGETEGKFTVAYDYYKQTDSLKTPGDIMLTPDLAHTFTIKFSGKSSLSIIPEADIDFGTRNAYSQYESAVDTAAVYKEVRKNGKLVRQYTPPNNTSFGTVDYNFILTLDLKIGHFEFQPAFTHNKSLYNPTTNGVSVAPTTPLNSLTIALVYTIDHHCKK